MEYLSEVDWIHHIRRVRSGFNPYFNGIPFGSHKSDSTKRITKSVSILILMEYLSED